MLPLAGFPITILGFVLGRPARLSSQRGLALMGMGVSLIGLLLTVANSYFGEMQQAPEGDQYLIAGFLLGRVLY
jgi:hypothetical protein